MTSAIGKNKHRSTAFAAPPLRPARLHLRAPSPGGGRLQAGFTLLEICIVIGIIALVVGMAIPSISSIMNEERLRKPEREFVLCAKAARRLAIMERRPYVMEMTGNHFDIHPFVADPGTIPDSNSGPGSTQSYDLPSSVAYRIRRWNDDEWRQARDDRWVFQADGLCEPLNVEFSQNKSWIQISLSPLTASVQDESFHIR